MVLRLGFWLELGLGSGDSSAEDEIRQGLGDRKPSHGRRVTEALDGVRVTVIFRARLSLRLRVNGL